MAVHCPFFDAGCQFLPADIQSVRVHIRENALSHLSILCEDVRQMYGDLRSLQNLELKQDEALSKASARLITLHNNPGAQIIWKIDEYSQKMNEAKVGAKTAIYSPAFFTSRRGYKLVLLACLNGDGQAKGNFMSVFVSICRGDNDAVLQWPFLHQIKLTLLSQAQDPEPRKDVTFIVKPNLTKENKPFVGRPEKERNAAFGAQNFVALSMLEKMTFVKDDCMFIRVDVDMENM